jgi:hypothetical protein
MEQPCYKCGQVINEGRVFCLHCGAPQIRVVVAEAAASPAAVGSAPDEAKLPSSESVPILALPISWSMAVKSCGLAALVASVLMFLGLYPIVAMPSAGFLAVVFYRHGQENLAIRPGAGLRLGAFGGLLYFGLIALFTALAAMLPGARAKLHEMVLDSVQKFAASHPDNLQVRDMVAQLNTPEGFVLWLIACGVALLIASIVLGGVGGMLGGAIFGRRGRDRE